LYIAKEQSSIVARRLRHRWV